MRNDSAKVTRRAWDKANADKLREYKRRYRKTHATKISMAYADWCARNPGTKEEGRKRWRELHRDRYLATCARSGKKWRKANKEKVNAKTARRRAAKLQATPAWANQDVIRGFYVQAKLMTERTGIPHEVDHIIPLQGKLACGLHNEFNLRVISRSKNRAKHNRMRNTPSAQRQGRLIA